MHNTGNSNDNKKKGTTKTTRGLRNSHNRNKSENINDTSHRTKTITVIMGIGVYSMIIIIRRPQTVFAIV